MYQANERLEDNEKALDYAKKRENLSIISVISSHHHQNGRQRNRAEKYRFFIKEKIKQSIIHQHDAGE